MTQITKKDIAINKTFDIVNKLRKEKKIAGVKETKTYLRKFENLSLNEENCVNCGQPLTKIGIKVYCPQCDQCEKCHEFNNCKICPFLQE